MDKQEQLNMRLRWEFYRLLLKEFYNKDGLDIGLETNLSNQFVRPLNMQFLQGLILGLRFCIEEELEDE